MSVSFIGLSILFFGFYALLSNFKKQKKSFNFRVLSALAAGLLFGGAIQLVFGVGNVATSGFAELISVFGKGYIKLLQMIVIPLVFVAMISSIMNVEGGGALSRIAPKIIGILLFTCAISAAVGIASIYLFGIDANALVSTIGTNSAIEARGDSLVATQDAMASSGLSGMALSIIPTNIFDMLTGSQRTSTLSTVLFGMFLGYCILQVKNRKPEKVQNFVDFINSAKEVVLSMVREILKLTPYGVFALMTTFMMTNDLFALAEMGRFLLASYVAIGVMFGIHFVMVSMFGLSPAKFMKKIWPVLVFGFGSRSSMAAQVMGMPVDLGFILQLIAVIAIASFGIAGVGGGATFAAVAVLTIMGLDITVVAILVSIEALIDMARTALNISGSMLSGVLTAKKNGSLNTEQYDADVTATVSKEAAV